MFQNGQISKQATMILDSLPEPILTISDILEGYRNETLV